MSIQRVAKSDFMAKVGLRIRVLRLERGFSIRTLAEQADCSASSIMQIELGRSGFTTDMLQKLAHGLGVQPFDILNHDTHMNDLGWMIEATRLDANSLQWVRKVVEGKRLRAKRAPSSVPASS